MDSESSPFHAGEHEAQRRASVGRPGGAAIRNFMPEQHREFFRQLPFVAVAVLDHDGWPTSTLLTGTPGFVSSPEPHTLRIATARDERDPAARFLVEGASIGILGIDLSTRRRNRLNGRIAAANSDLLVGVDQSFGNCPQYVQARSIEPRPVEANLPSHIERLVGLDEEARDQIRTADTFFVATSTGLANQDKNGGVDMSHRGGRPGFVRVDGDTLTIPDFRGNRYFNTLGNLLVNPRAALLFVDFERGDILCVQGETEIIWDPGNKEVTALQGAERLWRVHVMRGWRRLGALPFCWHFRAAAPTTDATGVWGHDVSRRTIRNDRARLQAFERLALPHRDAAHNLAYWLVRSRPDAEDIVQDAYVRAFRAFKSCKGDVKPWLLTIVRNVAYRWLSVRQRASNVILTEDVATARELGVQEMIPSEEPSAETLLIGAEERALVLAALAKLPPMFREVLVLREIEELSYGEIASVIGSPAGTVMSRLSRSRAQLKI
jgi:RNA polymerase sigma factor (sigma-70 family)